MKSGHLLFLFLLVGLFVGCEPKDPCEYIECGPGECIEGICDCPEGFIGSNCEIPLCFGVPCINGDCDQQTESCICNENYFGEECSILCKNGDFEDGECNCHVGYEGIGCDIESRDRFLGWWSCEQWTWTPKFGDSLVTGFLPATIKFECGSTIPEIELFPTTNSSGLMLLSSSNRIIGQVSKNTINFELQYLTTEVTVYGSASLGGDQILSIQLNVYNPETSFTEIANGTFTIFRHFKECE